MADKTVTLADEVWNAVADAIASEWQTAPDAVVVSRLEQAYSAITGQELTDGDEDFHDEEPEQDEEGDDKEGA